uniref:Uncharacterized protein n=1 Tax=Oryza punctata TaxID=4537 RepID=A0A0E0JX67_ORYPU
MSTELICSTWSVWFSMNISTISGKVCCPYVNAIFYMERNDQHWRFSEWQLRHQHAEIVLNKLRFHRCQRLDFWIYLLMSTLQMVQLIRWILAWEHPFSAIVRTCCQFLVNNQVQCRVRKDLGTHHAAARNDLCFRYKLVNFLALTELALS